MKFYPGPPLLLPHVFLLCIFPFLSPSQSLWSEDNPADQLAEVFAAELRPSVESLLNQFRRERRHQVSDFPMDPETFRKFQKDVIDGWTECLGMERWVVRNPQTGKSSPIASQFNSKAVKKWTLDSGVRIEAHVIDLLDSGDRIPIVICIPPSKNSGQSTATLPGVLCCPGHGNQGLYDLVFGRLSYQKAIAVRLAEAGFASVAVEKIDSGYLSRSAPRGNDEKAITTFRLGLGKDTTRAVQLKATLAAAEVLAAHQRVDGNRIGATGVSLGGWLAVQTGLLSDRIKAVAEYATKTVFLGDDADANSFSGVSDLCHLVPGSFQLGDRNILMFPFAPRPLLSGHGGPADRNSHREHEVYYKQIFEAQYQSLGKGENFRYHVHSGGHSTHPETVIAFFREQL